MDGPIIAIMTAMVAVATLVFSGAVARQLNWLTQEADKSLLNLTVRVLLPCLIFDVIVGNPKMQALGNVVPPPLAGFIMTSLSMFLGWFLVKALGKYVGLVTPAQQRTFAFTVGVVNYGFIPIPLTQVLFDHLPVVRDATMGVLVVHNAGVDLAVWTVGILILTGAFGRDWWKRVINPVSLTIAVSLLINAMGLDTLGPDWIRSGMRQAVHLLGQASVPLSLALVGASVVDHLSTLAPRQSMGVITFGAILRLGLLPIAFMATAWLLPVSDELKRVLVIQGAMPSAMAPIILARHYQGDPATALRVAMGTTLIALITIPLWLHGGLGWLNLGP